MRTEDLKARHGAMVIWGYGLEGRAARDWVCRCLPDIPVFVSDRDADLASSLGDRFIPEPDLPAWVLGADRPLIVKSPGISPYFGLAPNLKGAGAAFTSLTNLWLANRRSGQIVIGITGTKGKSTTASLAAHILKTGLAGAGRTVELAGNVGRPVTETDPSTDVIVMEVSSYQATDLAYPFDFAVVINLYSDHIPWHGDLTTYQRDKLNLLRVSAPSGVLVAPADLVDRIAPMDPIHGLRTFGSSEGLWVDGAGTLRHRDTALDVPPQILGAHNRRNLAAALTLAMEFGIDPRAGAESLESFKPLPHRLETVGTLAGITYVNDSIASTPEAAWSAVQCFPGRDLVLILGGTERDQDYGWLAERLKTLSSLRHVVLIPDNNARIEQAFAAQGLGAVTTLFDRFDDAIHAAPTYLAGGGGVVLLSPAAPRGSEFPSIMDRGDRFRALVETA